VYCSGIGGCDRKVGAEKEANSDIGNLACFSGSFGA
jgi:hypothetical protein